MEGFAHFVITRFNLQLYKVDKKKQSTRTDTWLSNRFAIFEAYCLPSIKAQECRNFTWLVLFDADTPPVWRARIDRYRRECLMFHPVFYTAAEAAELEASLKETIRSMTTEPWVLTTNLDNDDALSIRAVAELQARIAPAAEGKKVVYSLLHGYQYLAEMDVALKMRYTNNHFLTLLERNDEQLETIISYHHARVVGHFETVFISTPKGMWLEVVHADNVSNELRINAHVRNTPILKGRDFTDFGLPLEVTAFRQVTASLFVLPWKFAATAYHRLRTKRQRMKNPNPLKGN